MKDFAASKPEECFRLWEKAVREEHKFIQKNPKEIQSGQWWPGHYNGELLTGFREYCGDEKYMELLNILLDYPTTVHTGIKPETVFDELKQIGTAESERLLKKLCDQNPKLYGRGT